jgi:phospholipid-translocating ATPase
MNSKMPRSKIGLLDQEINFLSKVLFVLMLLISGVIILADGFIGRWYFKYFRFVLLLASIIPISLRVNLDLAKIYYSYCISTDKTI